MRDGDLYDAVSEDHVVVADQRRPMDIWALPKTSIKLRCDITNAMNSDKLQDRRIDIGQRLGLMLSAVV